MRLYIAGPITGCPDYRANFARAEMLLREKGYGTVNPAAMNRPVADAPREKIMRLCRAELECCDAIYMLEGWGESEGARQEYGWAKELGMEAVFEGGEA